MMYFTNIREHSIPLFIDADVSPVSFMYYKTVASLRHDIRDLKHRELNGRRRRFPTEADWAKGFVFGGENEV